ncbi:hypothetical protein HDG38_006324 [Paraburkholderia sp. WSM4177]|nr:hypothetical protein [Paraburkholderia sp. WSM4177]MBB5488145.1 hypothetical protein [Paraburkholderia sp. WSM4180]
MHDPPQENPFEQWHWVDDPGTLLVHVTHFNRLMWDSGVTPTRVIEHGVVVPDGVRYNGELQRGIVVVNHIWRSAAGGSARMSSAKRARACRSISSGWTHSG